MKCCNMCIYLSSTDIVLRRVVKFKILDLVE